MLREVARLSQEEGINLAGVKRIIELEAHVGALQQRVRELHAELEGMHLEVARRERKVHQSYRRDLVPIDTNAVVVWRPQPPQS